MGLWIVASAVFFIYVLAVALLLPRLSRRSRLLAASCSLLAMGITAGAWLSAPAPLLHDWLVPPLLLLIGYWTSGLLFAAPMRRVEAALSAMDRWLEIEPAARSTPRWRGRSGRS